MVLDKLTYKPNEKNILREIHAQNLNTGFFLGIITLILGMFMYSGIASFESVLYRKNIMGRLAFLRTPAYIMLIAVSAVMIIYALLAGEQGQRRSGNTGSDATRSDVQGYSSPSGASFMPGEYQGSTAKLILDGFVIYFYVLVCAAFGIFIAALEYQVGQQAYIFLLMMLLAFCVLALNPVIVIPMIIASFLIFFELCRITVGVSTATGYRWAISAVIVCIISFIRWNDARTRFRTQHMLTRMSLYDALTDCKNRNSFRQEFDDFSGSHVALMVVDLDHFKEVNDKYGHATGDVALHQFGLCLKQSFGAESVYRFGGDEFIVAMKETEESEFRERCETLREKLAAAKVDGMEERLHCSGGFVVATIENAADMRYAVNQADEQLYHAKNAGRRQIVGKTLRKDEA